MEENLENPTGADIGRVVAGNKAAWDDFVEKFSGLLHAVVLRTMKARVPVLNREDARDAVQDVFLKLVKDDFRLLKTFDPSRASLPTWLTVVARSTAVDFLKRPESRRDSVELDDTFQASDDVHFGGRIELPQDLLSASQHKILRMLFDEDMDVAEVAGALGVQAQTVRSLKHQALARLREHYRSKPAA